MDCLGFLYEYWKVFDLDSIICLIHHKKYFRSICNYYNRNLGCFPYLKLCDFFVWFLGCSLVLENKTIKKHPKIIKLDFGCFF